MPSSLEVLKQWTRVVADTGDFDQLTKFTPQDATTNPSLIYQAVQLPQYKDLVAKVIKEVRTGEETIKDSLIDHIVDCLYVAFGCEILKIIPGVVSTEVDARLSFDIEGSVAKARKIIHMYEGAGYNRSRVLIKLATTWEGCEAAKILQNEGINCNMTLLFGFPQAAAAAEAGAFLISPFVGRILDWYKAKNPNNDFCGANDPGVRSVRYIYKYYKKYGYKTIVMGASFRNIEEIKALSGCDCLTISPKLLDELAKEAAPQEFSRILSPECAAETENIQDKVVLDEKTFRWMLNEDAMATEKLSEGIRNFNKDHEKLRQLISTLL